MRKFLKITGYIVLAILLLLVGFAIFLNSKYNSSYSELTELQAQLEGENDPFYQFELRKDSITEFALLPVPKKIVSGSGMFSWGAKWNVNAENLPGAEQWVNRLLANETDVQGNSKSIKFVLNDYLKPEAYDLTISQSGIDIAYSTAAGAYYAVVTLHQLKHQYPQSINSISIYDEPDLEVRGMMLDISRDKVPQLETIKDLVDKLSMLKYNHLELYVEGFSFGYPSFESLWKGKETPITPAEIRELDAYCKERFIDLVPNQNSLGHMQAWLETPEFEHLAECPEGYEIMPMRKVKTTLDPSNPESIELVEQMMDDMLPNFSSNIFNANLDEPFELGHCNNADLAEEVGVGKIYLDFVVKVYDLAKERNKEFWMWGDIIGKHPELLDELPKDITVLEWGYEAEHPFKKNTARIKEQGIDFLVCPGTSSWMTLTGRTDNMLGNIKNAVLSAVANDGKGMLLTDWGDMGHWQYLPVSYPGIVYAGGISWNSRTSNSMPLERYLNNFIFQGVNQDMAEIVMKMGRSYHFEERHLPNMSHNFMAYQFGLMDQVLEQSVYSAVEQKLPELVGDSVFTVMQHRFVRNKNFQADELNDHLNRLESDLNMDVSEMSFNFEHKEEDELVRSELRNGIQMVRLGAEIRTYGQKKQDWTSEERIEFLTRMQNRLADIQKEHKRLWLERNKPGGLERSMEAFQKLDQQIQDHLETEQGSGFGKSVQRFKEKMISGGASWLLN